MKTIRSVLLAGAMALPLAMTAANAETPDNVLVVAQNIDDIISLDPAQAYEFTAGELLTNIYDRLVQYDAEDPTVLAPGLAESWEIDAENKTITFELRDATFHSGNPVRGEDVVFSFKRVVELNLNPGFILTQLGWTPENVEEMVTADGNTVTVKYAGDFSPAFVMNVLAARPASVVDMEVAMANEVDGDMGNAWLGTNSAGTGPFILAGYRPSELVRLTAYDNYFKEGPKIEQVIIRHTVEAATQQLLLEQGDADMARNLTPDQVASIDADGVRVEVFPQAAIHFLVFNQNVPELTNEALWEASRYLIDYEGMTNSFLKGQMEIHQSWWPEGFPGAVTDTPYSYDLEKAKQILTDAGVELPINVSLDIIAAQPFTDMAQSLQATFADADINFEITSATTAQMITRYRAREHQAAMLYWGPDFMDPHSNAKAFAYNSNNDQDAYAATTTWRNSWAVPEELNDMTREALTESDPAKREEIYTELQKIIQVDSPIMIMFQASYQVGMSDKVSGYVNGATSDFVFYRLVEKN
ncbi:MAG: ABC transporter substrate-binding protein [Pseudomonadota bacterium]